MRLLNLEPRMTKEPMVSNPQIYCIGDSHASICNRALMHVVEVTKTVPLEKLVWIHRKEPDNERQEIHNRTEDPYST